ncbi:MAG TPA: hypothetical protein VIG47_15300, partial [Gemmatimonadaceae bacterium]
MTSVIEQDSGSNTLDRRSFLAVTAGGFLAAALGRDFYGVRMPRRIDRIGVQLYTIRDALTRDLDGSLARVAAIGYQEVELAGYRGHSVSDFKAALDRHGLAAPSTHIAMERVRDELPKVLDEAHLLGHRFVVCPNIADEKAGLDGYRQAADV